MRAFRLFILIVGSLLASWGLLSCGGASHGQMGLEAGSLGVFIADALPDPTITNVEIDIAAIEANLGGYWVRIAPENSSIDLLEHVDDPALVALGPVSPGRFLQIRLRLSAMRVADADGVHDVSLTDAQREGIDVDFPFDMHAGSKTSVLLDFNVHRSLRKLGPGNYTLVPTILPALRSESGCVFGKVGFGGFERAIRVRAEYVAGDARAAGTQVNDTFAREDGTFRIWALPAGTYRVVAEALNEFEGVIDAQVFEGVEVRGGEAVEVGPAE